MARSLRLTLAFLALACQEGRSKQPESAAQVTPAVEAGGERQQSRRMVTFVGTCDASGAVELDERHVLVADDENNVLRVYDTERGGPPRSELDLSTTLREAGVDDDDEADLEAATRAGDRAYFLASHGRTSKGKRDGNRLVFFAIQSNLDAGGPALVGRPYRGLLEDLLREPRLARYKLAEAAELAPKAPGGLNLEGLAAMPDGSLLLGFRNPVPGGRALLVGLSNPDAVLRGERARFSAPLEIDLGGLGVRALSSWRSSTLILAGPIGDGGPFRMFRLSEKAEVQPLAVDLGDLGAEAMFAHESRHDVLVLSDDGARDVSGRPCKKLKQREKKSFRGVWSALEP